MSNERETESTPERVVVVGAGLAAVRTAEELRRAGYEGELVLVGDETHLPYDRPPLSKEVLRGDRDDTTLRPSEFFGENRIELMLGAAARSVDTASRTLTLSDGTELGYDELVVATGLRPRRIPGLPDLAGVHVLRSLEDSRALREAIVPGARALVVGAGFIGCEVAASLRAREVEVVLVEPQPTPLASVLGAEVGALVTRLHTAEGVDVRAGVGLSEIRGDGRVTSAVLGDGRVTSAVLGDGSEIDVDLVVLGIGSIPATEWLEGSGVEVENGVVCDGTGRTSTPHVWAVGDVASWQVPAGGRRRIEHWTNAGEQASVLAKTIMGVEAGAAAQVPYFWSDQYDIKIQGLGAVTADDTVHVVRDDGRKFLAYYERDGRFVGAVGGGLPALVMKSRAKIAAGAPIDELLTAAV
ncbi:FAD-dependent oxidoreductase [Rhodococcus pyridinivorans]|uniref:NAD(P)/FAD-dependent oxidoreductase n=1 Tax=Rhodococcus pyridinivorans TaxID=103816 RepID=UPI001E53FF5E|nr:FAD-dependent oxidoreductase [Rhodococcus pyridinivorans]MCD2118521.1 FAD-dependent oxidoreductase [Rhodococcus pyridinivorans]MCZ4627413.1 FAD-dependent oxidoreductase [Rhodococcus pyridinivorans]MCZ4648626.1 FAD-dependent oxidoreductase [Rhodococcus pyridinivorans]MDJ0483274.1 FAD-dependent oxidoreductase [Rhodococcus pyridinivorans]